MVGRITKKTVDTLATKDGAVILWDRDLPRFGLLVTAGGAKSYVVQYRHHGRSQRITIGRHGEPWTPTTARQRALELLGLVARGADPAAARMALKDAPTVADLCDRFLAEHVGPKLKPTTAAEYRKTIASIIKPKLGRRLITDVTRADLAKLHHTLRATPSHANRALALCSKLFNLAERWGLRPDGTNPARHVEKFREKKRERYLTDVELARLGAVLALADSDRKVTPKDGAQPVSVSPYALAAIKLAILTGARRGELLTLQWEHVDLERGIARLLEHKTDRAGSKVISLNGPAVAILEGLPRIGDNPYVFPSLTRDGWHMVRVHDAWSAIREAAGIEDVRLHDLRHSHASIGVSAGVSLPVVGKMLGHASPATTQRYAHVAPDPVREASELIGQKIADAMKGTGR
jgi:integrase